MDWKVEKMVVVMAENTVSSKNIALIHNTRIPQLSFIFYYSECIY